MSRSVYEPYSDAEFDAEILRTQRSDRGYVAVRVAMLVVVYGLLARAVVSHGLTAGFLLLPLAAEVLTVFWGGLLLSLFVVDCSAFAKTGRRPTLIVFWTLLIAGIISAVLAWDDGTFDVGRIHPGWVSGWREVIDSGLIWAFVAQAIALAVATAPEVVRWRRVGGVFIWNSIFHLGMRGAVLLLLGVLVVFLLMGFAGSLGMWVFEAPSHAAWFVFGFLLVVEGGGLALGVAMHRDLATDARNEENRARD